MNVGKMRHRITFQRPTEEKDFLSGYKDDWFDVCTVWAQISPVSGKEYFSQVRETSVSHKIYCRYRPGITPRLRIKFKDRIFRIISVLNWDERNEGLTIMCEELVQ
ncbi:MAG: head-tail adaptor protein [Ruminococcaceae bacterium]|nr:head-tail adaptor protein [Oscillospiraceae bacterium]